MLNDQTQSNVTSGFETDSPPGSSASQARLTSDPVCILFLNSVIIFTSPSQNGQSMRYPFDTYTSTVDIVAAYQPFFNNTILPPDACRNWLTAHTAPDCSLTVQQSLAGWHAGMSLLVQPTPSLQITVERNGVVVGLACLLFAGWSFKRPPTISQLLTINLQFPGYSPWLCVLLQFSLSGTETSHGSIWWLPAPPCSSLFLNYGVHSLEFPPPQSCSMVSLVFSTP